jgi:hypothetical protein
MKKRTIPALFMDRRIILIVMERRTIILLVLKRRTPSHVYCYFMERRIIIT